MAWITPKTDWESTDPVTYVDYNRIKNNLLYLNKYLNQLDPSTAQPLDLGADKDYSSNYRPSEFNAFESALDSFKRVGDNVNVGKRSYYQDNGSFINASQLNRLESCCLNWFNYPVIESVTIVPATFSLDIGETKQLALVVTPSKASYTVTWTSSSNSIATVTSNGLVTAVTSGSFTITATVTQNGTTYTATASGEVNSVVTALSLSTNSVKAVKGNTVYVTVNVTPSTASNADDYEIAFDSDAHVCEVEKVKSGNTRQIKITFIKDVFDVYESNKFVWELQQTEDGAVGSIEMPKNTLTVSLGSLSATLDVQSVIGGTYAIGYDSSAGRYRYYAFEVIGQGKDGANNTTVIGYWYDFMKGKMTPPDSSANYRSVVQSFINSNFSTNLKNALISVSKEVMTGQSSKSSQSAKFFLPAINEVVDSSQYEPYESYSSFKKLGSVFYEFFAYYYVTYNPYFSLSRNTFYDNGYYSMKWDDTRTVGVADASNQGTYLQPLFFLDKGTKVVKIEGQEANPNEGDIYYIDWTGESSVTLGSLPLGSVVIDKYGTGRTG